METINTEIFVSSLFAIGFDKIDILLYNLTLGKLIIDNKKLHLFRYRNGGKSKLFDEYVDYDGVNFKLKDGISLDTIVSSNKDNNYTLRELLSTNKRLIDYLSELDFRKIIIKKIESLGVDGLDSFDLLFSNKEKEIIYKMFGIDNMHREKSKRQLENNKLSDLESRNISVMKRELKRDKQV